MNRMKTVALVVMLLLVGGLAFAAHHEPTLEKGKALFNDPQLGTNGKSCGSCHPDGKGLEMAGMKGDLAQTVNKCISAALKGKPLDEKSIEMQSLLLYIKSLHKM